MRMHDSLFMAFFGSCGPFLGFLLVAKDWDLQLIITISIMSGIGVGILFWILMFMRRYPLAPVEVFLPLKKELMDTKIALREVTRILSASHYHPRTEVGELIVFRPSGVIRSWLALHAEAVFVESSTDSVRVVGPRWLVRKIAKLWEAVVNTD